MIVTKRITFSEQKLFVFLMFCKNSMHVDRSHLFCLSHIDRIIYSCLYFMTNWTLSFSFYYFHFYRGLTSSEFWSVPNSSEVNKQIINVIKNEKKINTFHKSMKYCLFEFCSSFIFCSGICNWYRSQSSRPTFVL